MPKRKVANTVFDATLPKISVTIDGTPYDLCFDLGALAEAETYFRRHGHEVNLLDALPGFTLSQVRTLFPCALHKFHPDISFEEAQKMITMPTLYVVAAAVGAAWKASLPEKDADPPQAAAESRRPDTTP